MHIVFIGWVLLQAQLSSVDGIVTKPGGSQPLPGSTVTLNPTTEESNEGRRTVVTEEDGRFTFPDVVPGNYELTAESANYGRIAYGQRRPEGPGAILSVAAGGRISDLRLSMIPTGTITGRITKANGEPASEALVQAFRYGYQDGQRTLQSVQIASSDDRGEYRLFWLPAGKYVVAAAVQNTEFPARFTVPIPPGGMERLRESDPGRSLTLEMFLTSVVVNRVLDDGTVQEESWTPVYYPATTDSRLAVPIDVNPDATMTGVNIAVGPARVQRVRGRVIGENPGNSTQVMLLPQNSLARIPVILSKRAAVTTGGVFEFSGVMPGSYFISAQDERSGLVSPAVPVEVGDRDVDGVQVGLVPGVQLGVTMLLDNPSSGPQPVASISASLVSDIPALPDLVTNGQSGGTGRTTFRSVPPGKYQIEIESPGFHVKSVRFGNMDADDGIQVTAASPTLLEIVLTKESGSLEGVASGAGQVVSAGATVALVPATGRSRRNLYKSTVTDSEGRYRFDGIAPGDYMLFAWENVETGAWQNRDFMSLYEARGQPVHVSGNSTQNVPLTIIRNP